MPAINARELRRLNETMGHRRCAQHIREALREKHLAPSDFSIRELAEELIPDGREFVRLLDPRAKSAGIDLLEAGMAVNTAQFSNITGQIVFSAVIQAFQNEEFVFTRMISTITTRLSGEKIPGISPIGDEAEIVGEGNAYPLAGVNEDFIETPPTLKRGTIVPVTKEAIFFDRTGILLNRCSQVGEWLGRNKEKRAIDCVVDENSTAHRYKWRGTTIATYGDNSGDHTWDNLAASNALVDHTDIDAAELLLAGMLDPNTGEPILLSADTLIVNNELTGTAYRVINAMLIAMQVGGFATSGNLSRSDSASPTGRSALSNRYNILTSRDMQQRTATDTSWFLGTPSRAFAYMENWPITVVQAPSNSEAEFRQDIVAQFKASERGSYATMEPRLMVKSTA